MILNYVDESLFFFRLTDRFHGMTANTDDFYWTFNMLHSGIDTFDFKYTFSDEFIQ